MATKKPFGGKKAAPFVANPGGKKSVKRDPSSTRTAKGTKKKK